MSNANRDYAIVYDVKNSLLVLSRPLNFYLTDKNTSNIFVRLVTKVSVGNGIDQYTDIENATNYVLTMRVIKPDDEVKSLTATQHESESIFQFDLTEDFKDIPGKYICELTISNVVNGRQEFTTSDPFNYEVKRSILSNVKNIIEGKDTTVEKLLNDLDATKAELSSQINTKVSKGQVSVNDINKNLGKLDETYMTDEFLQQIVGTSPIAQTVADKSITTNKLAFNPVVGVHSNNLFNKNSVKLNQYIDESNGQLIDLEGWFASDFIIVTSGSQYFISPIQLLTRIAFYDKDKGYISKIDNVTTFVTPSNCKYIVIANELNELSTTYLNINSDKGYDEYGTFLDNFTIKDNSIEGVKIKRKSIDGSKLAINVVKGELSKNLFDKNKITKGYFLTEDTGEVFEIEDYFVSDYIEVEKITKYYLNGRNLFNVCLYDENLKFIKTIKDTNIITTTDNTCYIRFSHSIDILNSLQFEKGNTATDYVSYGVIPTNLSVNLNSYEPIQKITSSLVLSTGLKVKFIGDSITQGVGGSNYSQTGEVIVTENETTWKVNTMGTCWANMLKSYIEKKFNCIAKNFGTSGVTSSFILKHIDTLVTDDDIIICCIGTNDRNVGNETLQQLYSNLKSIYEHLTSKNKKVIFMSNIPASVENETDNSNPKKYHMEDVDNVYMKLASDLNVEYISIYKEFIKYCNLKGITIDSLLADGLHPNDTGYKLMYQIICEKLGFGIIRDGATW